MSEYMCDVCSSVLPRGVITFHSAGAVRNAIRDGFNPWTAPGIVMPGASEGSAAPGPDARRYRAWREMAMTDTSEWGLCPACTRAVSEARGGPQG